ncbi:hypothetical protein SO802_022263 [Lithocarpus litseifolius]|uniref:protein-serine/threonine phosphatase n=1 Tax=Lithocarpus litseifolius TaxID=425828 RepID=A0AAW2CJJ8_9ROSI
MGESIIYVSCKPKDRTDATFKLASLAKDNDRNKKIIVDEGGVPPLLKLLNNCNNNKPNSLISVKAQIAAAIALFNIEPSKPTSSKPRSGDHAPRGDVSVGVTTSTAVDHNHRLFQMALYVAIARGVCTPAGVAGALISVAATQEVHTKEPPPTELVPKDVVLYQYEACLFCNKVKEKKRKKKRKKNAQKQRQRQRPSMSNRNTVEEEEEEEESVIDLINYTGGDSTTSSSSAHADPMAPSSPPPPTPAIVMSSRDPDAIFSGGGISFLTGNQNGSFNYGYSTFKGKRASMEDFYETRISEVDGQMVAFFGVFDGHGGSRTAEYLKNNLFKNLSGHPDFINDPKTAIVEVFKQTDADYLNEEKGQQKDAGSTATTALLLGDRLLVANVGDSRVVACRAGSAIPLSIDHKPERSDERQRIEQAGGFIIWAGTWRVGGVLAVSRAFGDKLLKPYVVAEPEIQEEEIDGVDFIIIASDGLWNVISNKDAVALVQDIPNAEEASRRLITEAYARGSSDNITSIVVRFDKS